MMEKKDWLIILAAFLILSGFYVSYVYGLFESTRVDTTPMDIAKWDIKVNDDVLTGSTSTFTIDRVNWSTSTNVKEGKAAPGSYGYFDVEIDPNGTDTSIRYDITFDFSVLNNTSFTVDNIVEVNNKPIVRTGNSTYSNIMSLSEINNNETNTIRVFLTWANNEANNEIDSEIAKSENGKFRIPVVVQVTQHFEGEQLVPYNGG